MNRSRLVCPQIANLQTRNLYNRRGGTIMSIKREKDPELKNRYGYRAPKGNQVNANTVIARNE